MLRDKLNEAMKDAMRAKDTARLSGVDWRDITAADTGRDRMKDLGCQTRNGVSVRENCGRQGAECTTSRKLRSFLFAMVELRLEARALVGKRAKKGPGTKARPQEFAEPGTLSSTFPTNLPLPRSAPRGASSYRRPVLGAGRNLWHRTCPIKGVG